MKISGRWVRGLIVLVALASCEPEGGLLVFHHGETELKIVLPRKATDAERDAAAELAKFLHGSSGARFEIVPEGEAGEGIYVGRTDLAKVWGLTEKDLGDEGCAITVRSAEGKAAIVGGSDMATKFGVYGFLDRFVGVRWFLPGELFEIVPNHTVLAVQDCDIVEKPAFSPRAFSHIRNSPSPCYPGNHDPQFGSERWGVRNRISADGRGQPIFFSHNLYRIINPRTDGKSHPEYFPLRGGARYIPDTPRDQNWQPCTTNPDVIRLTIAAGKKFFEDNPECWKWFSLGINDGAGWCECEKCKALDAPGRTFRNRKFIASDRYYHFVSQVADALLKEFPDRKIGVIAYASVEPRPEHIDRLPPNVCVYITHDSSQYHDEEYLKQDLAFDKIWRAVSNNNLYRYDYYGLTWFLPRYFPHIIAEDARRMKKMGIHGVFAEECPAWPTVGPMLYVAARLLWNPDENPDARVKEFYTLCFGKAAEPMQRYWERQEQIWRRHRPGKWFEGLNDLHAQVALYTKEDVEYCEQQFDDAMRLAREDMIAKERIRFFHRGWEFAANYIKEHFLLERLDGSDSPEERCRIAGDILLAVSVRRQFWEEFKQDNSFLSGSYRWFLEELRRDGNWENFVEKKAQAVLFDAAARLAETSPGALGEMLARLRESGASPSIMDALETARLLTGGKGPENLLKNPAFIPGEGEHPKGADWSGEGAPPGWSTWRLGRGEFRFKDGVASVRGSDNGVVIQTLPVKQGEKVFATVKYRMKSDPPALGVVTIRWKQKDGKWLVSGAHLRQGVHMVTIECRRADDWRPVFAFHEVPEGATQAVFMFGAKDQRPDDVAEFKTPYFSKKQEPLKPQMNADGHR